MTSYRDYEILIAGPPEKRGGRYCRLPLLLFKICMINFVTFCKGGNFAVRYIRMNYILCSQVTD